MTYNPNQKMELYCTNCQQETEHSVNMLTRVCTCPECGWWWHNGDLFQESQPPEEEGSDADTN